MAKINNQAVVQKLIDELKLYPGADTIPTEIADKILAVYQINSEELSVTRETANIVRTAEAYSSTATIYTTPSTGKFFLTNVALNIGGRSAAVGVTDIYINVTIDGTAQKIMDFEVPTADAVYSNSLNLQNPVLVDAGTAIQVVSSGLCRANATIVGYTQEA